MPNPSAYHPPIGVGTVQGTFHIDSVAIPYDPTGTYYTTHAQLSASGALTFGVSQEFRPWTAGDILTSQMNVPKAPQVGSFQISPGTNFGFTAEQAAKAGLGGPDSKPFQNFNWVQKYTASGCELALGCGAPFEVTTSDAILFPGVKGLPIDTQRRIGSVDPLPGGNPNESSAGGGVIAADDYPEYWDQVAVPGAPAGRLYSDHNSGLDFADQPNLGISGLYLAFQTSLVGVYAGSEDNPVDLSSAFNDPEFKLNWLWVQQTTTSGSSGFAVTTSGAVDSAQNYGTAFFLGYGDIPTDTLTNLIQADLSGFGSTVPEPSTWTLLLMGFGALCLRKRCSGVAFRRRSSAQN